MTSRILGVVREQVLAALFGAGNAMDAYNIAFRIPNLVRDLFAEGAMSSAFVPTFTRHLTTEGKESAWRLGNLVVNGLIVITVCLVIAGMVFAEPLISLFAGAYRSVPGKFELTVFLTRLMLPFLAFVAISAAFMGMLNSLHRFFIPALSPAMFNVATIVCAIVLVPLMPALGLPAIAAIGIGALLGGVAQLAVQWPALRREGFRYRPILDWRDESFRRVLVLMGPGTIGLAATQVNVFVNTVLATGEGTGAVSWLNYAFRLMYLPIGLFGVSICDRNITRRGAARGATRRERRPHHDRRRAVADADAQRAGHGGPRGARDTDCAPHLRAKRVHGGGHGGDRRRVAVLRDWPGRLFHRAHRVTRVLRPWAEPDAGDGQRGHGTDQRAPERHAGGADGATAALRSAPRLPRSLMQRCSYSSFAGDLTVSTVAAWPGRLARITIASALMGFAAIAAEAAVGAWLPGGGLVPQIIRLAATIGVSLGVLSAAAYALGIQEFHDGVALVARRFRTTPR